MYISKNCGSGILGSENWVSGGLCNPFLRKSSIQHLKFRDVIRGWARWALADLEFGLSEKRTEREIYILLLSSL
jgi:hypothetical protein